MNDDERKFFKTMLIKKGGKAIHLTGDLTRDTYNAELIYVHNETETEWIGHYAEGFGFINVHFLKSDCREATEKEIKTFESGNGEDVTF